MANEQRSRPPFRARHPHHAHAASIAALLAIVAVSSACRRAPANVETEAPPAAPPVVAPVSPADDATEAAATLASTMVQSARTWTTTVPAAVAGEFAAFCEPAPAGMVCVRGGYFTRGSDEPETCVQTGDPPDASLAPTPAARVWVDTFYIDANEVTNAQFRQCVAAGACRDVRPLYRDFHRDEQPHTGGSWFDAMDYCAFRGLRLPTEAQFEAAIGGETGAATPFGDDLVNCDVAVIMDEQGRSCGVPQRGSEPDKGRVLEVGSRPPGRYGIYDLVGNAEEWALDWWTPSWEACGEACSLVNPRGPCDGALECAGHRFRAVRGSSWYWPAGCATRYHRRRYPPSNEPAHHFGFRCAGDVAQAEALLGARPASP